MSFANTIIWLLRDGKWHSIKEIMQFSRGTQFKTLPVLNFLWKFDFVDINKKEKKVRLCSPALEFMHKIEKAET
jgi:hypothetical protein